jgi:hypothetical protein
MVRILNVPKGPCVLGLFPGVALMGSNENFKRWGLMEGLQVIEGMSLKKLVGSCLFLLLFFTSWL